MGTYHADKFRVEGLEQQLDKQRLILLDELVTLENTQENSHFRPLRKLVQVGTCLKGIMLYNIRAPENIRRHHNIYSRLA